MGGGDNNVRAGAEGVEVVELPRKSGCSWMEYIRNWAMGLELLREHPLWRAERQYAATGFFFLLRERKEKELGIDPERIDRAAYIVE